jgi:hypothetical protein
MNKRLILFQGLPGSGLTTSVKRYADAQDSKIYKRIIVGNMLEPYAKPQRVTHATYNSYYLKIITGKTKWHIVKAMCDEVPLILVDFYNHDAAFIHNIMDYAKMDNYNVIFKQPDSEIWNSLIHPVLTNKVDAILSGDLDFAVNKLHKNQVTTRYDRAFIKRMMNKLVLR